jgi:CBS domain-containing protein
LGELTVRSGWYYEDFEMIEVKDIMTKNVVCIKKNVPVVDAIRLMSKKNITGIPVVEDDMTLLGIISEQDVLRLFHTYEDEKDRTVNDFMTQPAIHFEQDESLLDVCYCLRDNSIRRVPVTSNGKVVGVVSRSDILKCIIDRCDKYVAPAVGALNNTEP